MTAQSHGKAFVKATWDYRVCLLKPLQTACCVAFCPKCASVDCSEIHQPWLFPKHVTATLHMTLKPQRTEPEAWPWRLGVCGVITPFPSSSKASPVLCLCSPMSLGCRLGKMSRCGWNTEPHSGEKATGQRGVNDLHHVHIFSICWDLQPYPTQSRF